MRRFTILGLVLFTACSAPAGHPAAAVTPQSTPTVTVAASPAASPSALPSPSPSPQVSPSPAPAASPTLLFAALEAKNTNYPTGWNTVAIAGLDGYARAKAQFASMPTPWVGCAGPVLPNSAQVAAGKVFYADGAGVIHSLAPGGSPTDVTRLPMTSQQKMLSFAVSPDGSQLLATIFTIPPKPAGDPCASGGPMFAAGSFTLDVYAAQTGSAARLLYHEDLPTSSTQPIPNVMAFIGWDSVGPVGTYPTAWATQGGGPHHYNGLPVRIDATTGKVTGEISDHTQCTVQDVAPSGDFLCSVTATSALSVRRPDGTELWHYTPPSSMEVFLAFLAPDEGQILTLGSTNSVIGRNGTVTTVAAIQPAYGWLDSRTLIAGGNGVNFLYISLAAPGTAIDIGFTGLFIGTVRS